MQSIFCIGLDCGSISLTPAHSRSPFSCMSGSLEGKCVSLDGCTRSCCSLLPQEPICTVCALAGLALQETDTASLARKRVVFAKPSRSNLSPTLAQSNSLAATGNVRGGRRRDDTDFWHR